MKREKLYCLSFVGYANLSRGVKEDREFESKL